jgi:basic amino acid/polyamine antiporter, APA family
MNSPKKLNLFDSTMIIMGSMIGSGIFIVSAQISRDVQTPGLLILAWIITAIMTIIGALCYGELAAMMPKAGGQYIYLKEAYNPLMGFLYGWTLFTVIQCGTIAAVGVAFAKFLGVFITSISGVNIVFSAGPLHVSTQQLVAIVVIVFLSLTNLRGLKTGSLVQNIFTVTKIIALLLLVLVGLVLGITTGHGSWTNFSPAFPSVITLTTIGVFGAALVGSLFSADAWNNITFTAGEVRNPKKDIPRSLLIGTGTVLIIYILVNIAYVFNLPIDQIKTAENDRVATLLVETIMGSSGKFIMAVLIIISTFGCINGMVLAGARVYYAMANDGLFFRSAGKINKAGVPANALIFQMIWCSLLALSGTYGNLLDYVIFAVLLFYIFTIAGVFILRYKRPLAERPYKTWGYPVLPALYILLAIWVCISLLKYKPDYTYPGLIIVLIGVPVYFLVKKTIRKT